MDIPTAASLRNVLFTDGSLSSRQIEENMLIKLYCGLISTDFSKTEETLLLLLLLLLLLHHCLLYAG